MVEAYPKRKSLRDRMRWEFLERSTGGALPFVIFGWMVFVYPFGADRWALLIRVCALCSALICMARIPIARKFLKAGVLTLRQYNLLQSLTIANAISWSFVFGAVTMDFAERADFSVFAFTLFMGFCMGALYYLAASRFCFNFYISTMLGVQILALVLAAYVFHHHVDKGVLFMLLAMVVYTFREGAKNRARMIEVHRNQIRSEIVNSLLMRSRKELLEQTSRSVHSSRLASLGEMAGGVAHEINNPLAIIDLNLESLKIQLEEDGKLELEAAKKLIERSQISVLRITKIVRGLRNFSRAGDQDPLVAVPLKEVIEETLDFCREKIKAHEIRFELAGDTSSRVLCRPVEISQILINLINNSYDVVADLPVEQRQIQMVIEHSGRHALIRVSDSGPAVPAAVRDKFFQPFFTTKPVGAGTGLGLSISRAIAQKHGGDLQLDPAAQNTTFVLRLPLENLA